MTKKKRVRLLLHAMQDNVPVCDPAKRWLEKRGFPATRAGFDAFWRACPRDSWIAWLLKELASYANPAAFGMNRHAAWTIYVLATPNRRKIRSLLRSKGVRKEQFYKALGLTK